MVKPRLCECCGHPLPGDTARFNFTPIQARLYEVVRRAGSAGVGVRAIIDYVYAEDPEGGPDSANTVHVHRAYMNPKLAPHGLKISSTRGHGALWRLKPL